MKVIILTGKAGAGKTEISKIIKREFELKNIKSIDLAYASYLKEYAKKILGWDGQENSKPRTFLQTIGDKVKEIDPNFLVNRIKQDLKVYEEYFNYAIITDARFEKEIDEIKNIYDTIVINVVGKENNLSEIEKCHNTETSLDNYNSYDYKIDNRSSIENLEENIKNIMEELI